MAKRRKKKASPPSFNWRNRDYLIPLLVVLLITLIAFVPSLTNDFVNWDDDVNLLENPNMEAFDWKNIKGIFTSTVIGNYNPLPIFTLAIENALFGFNPTVYHVNNLILHLGCVFLVFIIVGRMGLPPLAAGFVALLFGIHPMRVESVAWVTERKDVLFGIFYFTAFYQYLKYLKAPSKNKQRFYWIIIALFVLALFSKIQAVALPLSMLAADYFYKRPLRWKLLKEKIPHFMLSLLIGALGIYFLSQGESLEDKTNFTTFQRLFVGSYSYCVYIVKCIFPYAMSPVYPYPSEFPTWYFFTPIPVLALFYFTYRLFVKRNRPVVFGIAFFTFNVMFMLQILSAGQGFIADRFTYIPYFGLFFLMGYLFWFLHERLKKGRIYLLLGTGMYMALFAGMTWKQCKIWESGETLWTHVLTHDTKAALPWGNRASYRRDKKMFDLALEDYNQAIKLKPTQASYYNSRGKLHFDAGRVPEALKDYNKAIELDAEQAEFFTNRGNAYARLRQYEKALPDFNKGIEMEPEEDPGYMGRSLLYLTTRNYKQALPDYNKLIELKPNDHNLLFERSMVYKELGNLQAAMADINKAINISQEGHYFLERADIYARGGNKAAARQEIANAQSRGAQPDPELLRKIQ